MEPGQDPQPSTSHQGLIAAGIDPQLTLRYVLGEISFEAYSEYLEQEVSTVKTEESVDDTLIVEDVGNVEEVVEEEAPREKSADKQPSAPKSKLSKNPELQGLMGEANLQFARENHKEAIKMCMEIIRQAPRASEPFETLAMIYEDLGDDAKHMQFALMAAHLNPGDLEGWLKLIDIFMERGDLQQAISCYDKAVRADPANMDLVRQRCALQERVGDTRRAAESYQLILRLMPKEEGQEYMQLSKQLYDRHLAAGEKDKAAVTLANAVDTHPELVTITDINNLLELYMVTGDHVKPVSVLTRHCGVALYDGDTIIEDDADLTVTMPTKCVVPDDLHIDLRSKLAICLIHLERTCAGDVMRELVEESAEEVGDIFLEVAEAYMTKRCYGDAHRLLVRVAATERYGALGGVWLRLAECLNAMGQLQQAVTAYERVVALAPHHVEARVSLSTLEQQMGRTESALQVLQGAGAGGEGAGEGEAAQPPADVRLLLPRCMLLYSKKRYTEFIDCARQVLFGHFKAAFSEKSKTAILSNRSLKHRVQALRHVMGTEFEQSVRRSADLVNQSAVTTDDLWELYLQLCDVLLKRDERQQLEDVSIVALMCPQFMENPNLATEADFMCLTACLLNRNGQDAYPFIRDVLLRDVNCARAWNLFTQVVALSDDLRHVRFILRMRDRVGPATQIHMMSGHNYLLAGSYRLALGEYLRVMQDLPHEPLVTLLLAVTLVHVAGQRFTQQRHKLVVMATALLQRYVEQRGECQEAYYNCGRAMHQLGLLHAAVFYYQRALALPPVLAGVPRDQGQEDGGSDVTASVAARASLDREVFDLRKDIAYNLATIYRKSGNTNMARHLLQTYIQM